MNEQEIYIQALTYEPAVRSQFLDQVCRGDKALRQRMERLFQHGVQAERFLEESPARRLSRDELGPARTFVGAMVGPYRIREQIGEGGMGVVYVAEQIQPVQRKVALKVIRPGMATNDVVARFEAERQALAMMEHPNISKVLDGGAIDSGQPYFVMELVQGRPLTEYCDQQCLSTAKRLRLFVDVCKAVQHAHQKGVIHRDLKPSNVLVPEVDNQATPKVIDFGVAKAMGQKLSLQTIYTQFSQFVGTPSYMSPEQAGMGVVDVDTRSDVYSLGVMLYELLTGSTPFGAAAMKNKDWEEMRRVIQEEEPRRPSAIISTLKADSRSTVAERRSSEPQKLCDALRGELDWIAMKALEKDRDRRYESASALADDIERYLSNQPVTARPPSTIYRFRKFVQRNKSRLLPTSVAAAMLLVGSAFALFAVVKERNEKQQLLHGTARRLYVSQVRQAATAWGEHDYGALRSFLQATLPNQETADDFRGWEWYFLDHQSQRLFANIPSGKVIQAAWHPDHAHVAVCVPRGPAFAIEYWKPESVTRWRELTVLPNPWPHTMRWSDDGSRLALGTWGGRVTVVDAMTGSVVFQNLPYEGDADFDSLGAIDLSPTGATLATASTFGNIRLWNVDDQRPIRDTFQPPATGTSADDAGEKGITSIAFSPDGHHLAIRLKFGRVITWDVRNDQVVEYERTGNARNSVDWHPQGRWLVSTDHHDVALYEVGTASPHTIFPQLDARSICWIDDRVFATGGADHAIRLWDRIQGKGVQSCLVDRIPIEVCGASPDGQYVAAKFGDRLRVIRLRELLGTRHTTLDPPTNNNDRGWHLVQWSPDGRFIVSGQNDGRVHVGHYGATIRIFDVQQEKLITEYSIRPNPKIEWSPDSNWVQVVDSEGFIHALSVADPHVKLTHIPSDASDYFRLKTFNTFTDSAVNRRRGLIAFDKRAALTNEDDDSRDLWVYDYHDLELRDTIAVPSGRKQWSPDGTQLLITTEQNVLIYDLQRQAHRTENRLKRAATAIGWNPNSAEVALGSRNGAVHVLDAKTLELRALHGQHRAPVVGLDWSPDGSRIASTAHDGTLRIWDGRLGDELAILKLKVPNDAMHIVDWSPDGRMLAVGIRSGEVYLLHAPSMPIAAIHRAPSQSTENESASPIESAIAALETSARRILVDDFNDGDDDGWMRLVPDSLQKLGLASNDASSGAYQLTTNDEVATYRTGGGFVAALWEKSSDPTYSNGHVRARVRVESMGCLASIAFRISSENYSNGYLFKLVTAPGYRAGYFGIERLTDGGRNNQSINLGSTDLEFEVGEEWWIEAGGVGDLLSMKVWRVGDPEPTSPQLILKDDTYTVGLFGVETNIDTYEPRAARINAVFDDISFTPLERVSDPSRE